MKREAAKKVASLLLEETHLRDGEISSRLKLATSESYWKELNPSLSIAGSGPTQVVEATAVEAEQVTQLQQQFLRQGYFKTEPVLAEPLLGIMRDCVETVRRENWPATFAYVYDEFWAVARVLSVARLLSRLLGSEYRQTSNIWTHYVPPRGGASGFKPHIDNPGFPHRLTLWISLSDATLDNGCIYVIPRDLIPTGIGEAFVNSATLERDQVAALLQGSRAIPTRAGEISGWDFDVIHWGSINRAGRPRISISMEFVGQDAETTDYDLPLLDVGASQPTMAQRLNAIGKALLAYDRFEPAAARYSEFARRLLHEIA